MGSRQISNRIKSAHWLRITGWIVLGYLVAVMSVTVITLTLHLALSALPDNGRFGSFYRNYQDLPFLLVFGGFYTFVFALPGFIMTLIAARHWKWFGAAPFAMAGLADAGLAHMIIKMSFGQNVFPSQVIIFSFAGGLVGGYLYWRTAHKQLIEKQHGS